MTAIASVAFVAITLVVGTSLALLLRLRSSQKSVLEAAELLAGQAAYSVLFAFCVGGFYG